MRVFAALLGRRPKPNFVCLYHHLVTISFALEISQEERAARCLPPTGDVLGESRMTWPRDQFVRDDIGDPQVLNGFRSSKVTTVIRRCYPAQFVRLTYDSHLMGITPDNTANGYVAGFASEYLAAARWVATGEGELIVPWVKS